MKKEKSQLTPQKYKGFELTFFQRHTNGQQAHENMFTITNY